jgi:signal transduction histidine kinase
MALELQPGARRQLGLTARMMIPSLGEGAAIVLFDGDVPRHAFGAHREHGKEPLAGWIAARLADERALALRRVIAGGEPIVVDDLAALRIEDAHTHTLALDAGFRSAVCAPVRAAWPGVITVWSSLPDRYEATHRGLVGELGQLVGNIVEPRADRVAAADDLLAAVRHDLGNPIQAIALHLDVLLAQVPETDRRSGRKQLEQARQATLRAQQLLGDLDVVTGARSGSDEPSCLAGAVVTEVLEMLGPKAADKQIRLICSLYDGGARVAIPSRHLYRVLSNLVGNAIAYCRAGSTVSITTDACSAMVTFAVRDDGPGIDVDDARKLFDTEWLQRSDVRQGSGLGLAICRRIVSERNGRISATTMLGGGSSFYVDLPRR